MKKSDVIVIGGGPSGLMAAGMAALGGASVLLLEKMPQPGRKLSITGKGRCNLTNVLPRGEFEMHFGENGSWLESAFKTYFSDDLMAFMASEGVALTTERGGRVFPENGNAPDVVRALTGWTRRQGVEIRSRQAVRNLWVEGRVVCGVQLESTRIASTGVVLACGGASYPGTGSTGDGYQMALNAGHGIVPPRPALVPLESNPKPARELEGLGLKNVKVELQVDGQPVRSEFGEMGFTAYGINGPVVLTLSGVVVDALRDRREVRLFVDLKPALSETKLNARLIRDLESRREEPMRSVLRGLLPKGLIGDCISGAGIHGGCTGGRLSERDRTALVRWMKRMEIVISGYRGMEEAIVTAGGIDLKDVCPDTMASRRVSGLYFAGEVLDLQADTGGYNLQAAFSTGVLAGRSVATMVRKGGMCNVSTDHA